MPTTSYTYTELRAALTDWMEDDFDDFTSQLDDIIGKAELRCYRDLDLEVFDTTDTAKSTTAASAVLALADNAILLRSLYVNDVLVLPRSETYVRHYQDLSANGQPLYYSQHDDSEILLAPIPDAVYATRQRVLKRPAGISASSETSFLATHAGDLLFWACVALSEKFDKAPEDAGVAEQEYQAILAKAQRELRPLARGAYA